MSRCHRLKTLLVHCNADDLEDVVRKECRNARVFTTEESLLRLSLPVSVFCLVQNSKEKGVLFNDISQVLGVTDGILIILLHNKFKINCQYNNVILTVK